MSSQKIPQKIKKKNASLTEEDKEKCNNYYSEIKNFIIKNEETIDKKIKSLEYFFKYDKENDYFSSDHYDHTNLETYGYYNKTKKIIYLSVEEAFYLNQIGIIKFEEDLNFNEFNLMNLNLYSYLRRSGKIPITCKMLLLNEGIKNKENISDNNNYYILFDDLDKYKNNKINCILYQHNFLDKINYELINKIICNSNKIYNMYKEIYKINSDLNSYENIICITQGISMTFLKIDDKIKI